MTATTAADADEARRLRNAMTIAFRKDGSHLASTSTVTCGFVPMQRIGGQPETFLQVPAPGGGHILLRYEDDAPAEPPLADDILASDPVTTWSGLIAAKTAVQRPCASIGTA